MRYHQQEYLVHRIFHLKWKISMKNILNKNEYILMLKDWEILLAFSYFPGLRFVKKPENLRLRIHSPKYLWKTFTRDIYILEKSFAFCKISTYEPWVLKRALYSKNSGWSVWTIYSPFGNNHCRVKNIIQLWCTWHYLQIFSSFRSLYLFPKFISMFTFHVNFFSDIMFSEKNK